MEQLKKILRQHYEKIVLVLVLMLMAAAAVVIYGQSQEQRQRSKAIPIEIDKLKVKGVKPAELGSIEKAIQAAASPPAVVLSGNHNLFNPVKWVHYSGQPVIKVETDQQLGPKKVQIERIRPLNLTISLDKVATSGTGDQRVVNGYNTVVTNDLILNYRRRIPQFMVVNDTNKQVFVITDVKGPAEEPTALVARLKDFGQETIEFGPGKPYVRVVGYEADLKYTVNGTAFPKLRLGGTLTLESDTYKVVDITENTVVISDQSNGKRYTIGPSTPP